MLRLRVLRILLPGVLVLFVVLLAFALRERPSAVVSPGQGTDAARRSAKDANLVEIHGERKTLEMKAGLIRELEDGKTQLEQIEEVKVSRSDGPPLVISAKSGIYEGAPGERRFEFDDQVVIHDPAEDLTVWLPVLDIDEEAGVARSEGEVRFRSGTLEGRASLLVYSLDDRPTELFEPVVEDDDGGRLSAPRGLLHDGLEDVELFDGVVVQRGDESLRSGRMRIQRTEEGAFEHLLASEDVRGVVVSPRGRVSLLGREAEVWWNAGSAVERMRLEGDAEVQRGPESLAAERVEMRARQDGLPGWDAAANGTVYLQGQMEGGPIWLRCETLEAKLGPAFGVYGANAVGNVRFEGSETRAEASRAEFDITRPSGKIRLYAGERRRARLAHQRTRVAANRIETDPGGETLVAEERVEATLLPSDASAPRLQGLFESSEAVHFVSARLEAREAGARLVFQGNVRGWQGEENLSAEEIELDQRNNRLWARRNVGTRIPRSEGGAGLREEDYIQISAENLEYTDSPRRAVYEGDVRVRLVEGWLEAQRIEVDLIEGQGISELRAFDEVRVEFRDPGSGEGPRMFGGQSDRLVYEPATATVRLIGVDSPASVRRMGPAGGTTTGRVLRYQMENGTLEVESSEQGPARIRSEGQ
ncbi:MAG: hypothetical protein GY716_11835 [bacterium]|nr:hypothetical protein [bacterium]